MEKKLLFVSLFLISVMFISSCAQLAPLGGDSRKAMVQQIDDEGTDSVEGVGHKCCKSTSDGLLCSEVRDGQCEDSSCSVSDCVTVITH
tara:strand:- start:114 stop:380 length:267 start_codon:yes stop_codon:yes gene_type:complete